MARRPSPLREAPARPRSSGRRGRVPSACSGVRRPRPDVPGADRARLPLPPRLVRHAFLARPVRRVPRPHLGCRVGALGGVPRPHRPGAAGPLGVDPDARRPDHPCPVPAAHHAAAAPPRRPPPARRGDRDAAPGPRVVPGRRARQRGAADTGVRRGAARPADVPPARDDRRPGRRDRPLRVPARPGRLVPGGPAVRCAAVGVADDAGRAARRVRRCSADDGGAGRGRRAAGPAGGRGHPPEPAVRRRRHPRRRAAPRAATGAGRGAVGGAGRRARRRPGDPGPGVTGTAGPGTGRPGRRTGSGPAR